MEVFGETVGFGAFYRVFRDQVLKHGGMPLVVVPGWALGDD